MRVLLVEDDQKLARIIMRALKEAGYGVDTAHSAKQAMLFSNTESYAAAVFDVLLPDLDGFALCASLRDAGWWVPVLFLTARSAVEDRIEGLDRGGDDYLTKPFSIQELTARLRALIRRGQPPRPTTIKVGDLSLDVASRKVFRSDRELAEEFTPREFALLELLMRNPGVALSRSQIIDQLWSFDQDVLSNVVDQYIGYLRKKIDTPFNTHSIETVRGVGYRLSEHTQPRS